MIFDYKLYLNTVFHFSKWLLKPRLLVPAHCLALSSFSLLVRIFRLDSTQDAKLFNYFYLSRYFLGQPSKVFSIKKFFVLGQHYYNVELGFIIAAEQSAVPLSIWVLQIQPLANLPLTRDYVISARQLQWTLKDPSIFSERKTNTGLFYLADPLTFYLSYREVSKSPAFVTKKLLSVLKLIFD